MKFTKERPTQAGWYWCKTQLRALTVVEVYKSNPLFKHADSIAYAGLKYTLDDPYFECFAGPLELPVE